MATVSIELSELNRGQEAGPLGTTTIRLVDDRHGFIQMKPDPSKASGSGNRNASPTMQVQAGSSEDDDDGKYGCHIIKEPPDPSHEI